MRCQLPAWLSAYLAGPQGGHLPLLLSLRRTTCSPCSPCVRAALLISLPISFFKNKVYYFFPRDISNGITVGGMESPVPYCVVHIGVVSHFPQEAKLSLGSLRKGPLLGEGEVCPGLILSDQRCPVLGSLARSDLSFQSYWGDSRDTEETVLGVRRATLWKVFLPAGPLVGGGSVYLCITGGSPGSQGERGLLTRGRGSRRGHQSPEPPDHLRDVSQVLAGGLSPPPPVTHQRAKPQKMLENTSSYPPRLP